MTIQYYLRSVEDNWVRDYLADLTGKSVKVEKLVDGEKKWLFSCPHGFSDVDIALTQTANFGVKIEVYEEDTSTGRIERYDPHVKLVRRKEEPLPYRVLPTTRFNTQESK